MQIKFREMFSAIHFRISCLSPQLPSKIVMIKYKKKLQVYLLFCVSVNLGLLPKRENKD